MSYTTEEIQAAVEKLVNGAIRRPTDTLGTRRPDVTFGDVQEAAAGAFILYPLSPFYALLLGSKRVVELVRSEASLVVQLKAMVGAVGRRVLPVADVESLFNAKAALQQLEVAVSKQAPKDITKLPAFQRFASNVSDFLIREGSKVKEDGVIVPTPQEARAAIPDLVRQLVTAHEELKATVSSISNGIADYNSVNLPALVAKGVVSRAREVLGTHADELDAMQPEERLGSIRDVVLDLLAAKSVVQKFGSAGGFTIFVPMSGTGIPYSDATHEATPAALATRAAPYVIVENVTDELLVTADGGIEVSVRMNRSLYAQVSGIARETLILVTPPGDVGFVIGDGINPALGGAYVPPDNNKLKFRFTDLTGFDLTITVTLTPSPSVGPLPVPVLDVCAEINAELLAQGLNTKWLAEPYFLPIHFMGALDITSTGGSTADFTIPANGGADLSFILNGDVIVIDAGLNAGTWKIYNILSPTSFQAYILFGGTSFNELAVRMAIGDKQRGLRIRAIAPLTMVIKESTVTVVTDNDKNRMGAMLFGFFPYLNGFCRPSTAQMVADDLTQKFPAKLSCERVTSGIVLSLRTEPGFSTLLVSSKLRTLGAIVFTAGGPNSIAVTGVSGLLAAGVVVGDYVVLRGGTPPGTSWLITAMTDTTCTATSTDSAVSTAGVSLEFGTAPAMNRWEVVEIATGPIQGVFHVAKQGTSVLDIVTIETVPASQDPATRTALLATGTYGTEHVIINSRARTTASAIAINAASSGLNVLFASPPATARGVSPWFQLPQASHAVDTGDQLETHATDYANPSNVYAITSVSGRLIGISPSMPSNASWVFDDQPVPFARIRNGVNLNFTEYKTLLDAWLLLSANSTTYYRDLNRLLNPLLHNASPTAEQVGSTLNHLSLLLNYLLINDIVDPLETIEGSLLFYKVDTVSAVDTLIKSFVEKGADRAIDLLLQGQFSMFFGMDIHDVSYAGYMQKGIREVVQKDIPVRSTKRLEANQSRLRASSASPDYEYSLSDSDDVGVPDIPADYDDTPR